MLLLFLILAPNYCSRSSLQYQLAFFLLVYVFYVFFCFMVASSFSFSPRINISGEIGLNLVEFSLWFISLVYKPLCVDFSIKLLLSMQFVSGSDKWLFSCANDFPFSQHRWNLCENCLNSELYTIVNNINFVPYNENIACKSNVTFSQMTVNGTGDRSTAWTICDQYNHER